MKTLWQHPSENRLLENVSWFSFVEIVLDIKEKFSSALPSLPQSMVRKNLKDVVYFQFQVQLSCLETWFGNYQT